MLELVDSGAELELEWRELRWRKLGIEQRFELWIQQRIQQRVEQRVEQRKQLGVE